ncbi:MAG: NADH:flavin oxidoreductase [Nocardioides sp.]
MTTPGDQLSFTRGPDWRNRMALAPLTNLQSGVDGVLSDDELHWLVARGVGGFGLTMTCAAYVNQAGKAWPGQLGISTAEHVAGLTRLAEAIRATESVSSVQLHHGGMRASAEVSGVGLVAPWDDVEKGVRALTTDEVREAIDDFVSAAVTAEKAGFDGVELHGAHGYLIGQFLDGRHNQRVDGYGGSLEDRSRFLHEVLDGVRAATGPDFQLGLRLTPERNGIIVEEAAAVLGSVMATGHLDYVDLSLWDVRKEPHEPGHSGLLIDQFVDVPRHGTRLAVAGKVLSAADVQWCLDRRVDAVFVGTGAIIHHDFAARAEADPTFASLPQPVSREHLEAESVGPAFIDYLASGWDDFVA